MDDDISALLAELSDDPPSPTPFGGVYGAFESLEDFLARNSGTTGPNLSFVPVVPGIETLPAPKPRRGRKKRLPPLAPALPIVNLDPLPPLSCDGRGLAPVVECRKLHSPMEVEEVARKAAELVRTALQARQAYDALHMYGSVKHALGSLEKQANYNPALEEQKRAAVEAAAELVQVAHLAPPPLARAIKKKKKNKSLVMA